MRCNYSAGHPESSSRVQISVFFVFSLQPETRKSVKKLRLSPLIARHVDGNYTAQRKANYIVDVLSKWPSKTNVTQAPLLGVSLAYFLKKLSGNQKRSCDLKSFMLNKRSQDLDGDTAVK